MTIEEALRKTRNDSGHSQEFMAFELGISRKTVMKWESGTSEPSIGQAMEWFKLTGRNPVPFLLQIAYPAADGLSSADNDSRILENLLRIIRELPGEGVRQLMYLFFGKHGSSPRAVLQMICAHLQSPLKDRIAHGELILTDYELSKLTNTLTDPDHIQPDMAYLKDAIRTAKQSVASDAKEYGRVEKS